MKHIPNILTICNLICGCFAITHIMGAHAFMTTTDFQNYYPVLGSQQIYWGSIFIFFAALFDVLDGLAARTLNAYSPIGKDLDSLADVISFGVAPSMIFYQLLWKAYMQEPGALDTPLLVMIPGFLIAAFAAVRLATFNQTNTAQKHYFIGMPVPTVGIISASIPLIMMENNFFNDLLSNRWLLYALIAVLSILMVSKIKFFKWKSSGIGIKAWIPQIIIAASLLITIPFLGYTSILVAFFMYIILSVLWKHDVATINNI